MRAVNFVIAICVLASTGIWLTNPTLYLEYLVFSGDNLLNGRLWTLFTSIFLHATPLHLFINMIFLYIFGNTVESEKGPGRTLGAFFFGGALSFLLSVFFYPLDVWLIGASAAIFTLEAIVMLIKPLKTVLFLIPQGLIAILYFVYNAIAVYYNAQGNVAYIGHIIGFAIGVPFGIAWSKNWLRNLFISIVLLVLYFITVYYLLPRVM